MGEVVKFRLSKKPSRQQVMQWLCANVDAFPEHLPGHASEPIFCGWRFVRGLDGEVYFANCIERGISEGEFSQKLTNT